MLKSKLTSNEIQEIKKQIKSIEPAYLPFFLSSFITRLDILDSDASALCTKQTLVDKKNLKTLSDFEKLIGESFPAKAKMETLTLLKEEKKKTIKHIFKNNLKKAIISLPTNDREEKQR